MTNYENAAEVGAAVMLLFATGFLLGLVRGLGRTEIKVLNDGVFYVFLPCTVIYGISTKDFFEIDVWPFVLSFLYLRIAMSVLCGILALFTHRSWGFFTTDWLATTWISTVILGGPIIEALYGKKQFFLCIMAALSSFFFQLPLMLWSFDMHQAGQQRRARVGSAPRASSAEGHAHHRGASSDDSDDEKHADATTPLTPAPPPEVSAAAEETARPPDSGALETLDIEVADAADGAGGDGPSAAGPRSGRPQSTQQPHSRREACRRVARTMLHNPVLGGITTGFILSFALSPSDSQLPDAISQWLQWFAGCTTPVGVFIIGLFAAERLRQSVLAHALLARCSHAFRGCCGDRCGGCRWCRGKRRARGEREQERGGVPEAPWRVSWQRSVSYLVAKFVLVPPVMLVIVALQDLDPTQARVAVVISVIPVSLASFSLAERYNVAREAMAVNVVVGTLLMIPVIIVWLAIMDAMDWHEIPAAASPVVNATSLAAWS